MLDMLVVLVDVLFKILLFVLGLVLSLSHKLEYAEWYELEDDELAFLFRLLKVVALPSELFDLIRWNRSLDTDGNDA